MDEYIVEEGDTIQRLAIKFNCSPSDIAKENKISTFQMVVFVGQKLRIPKPEQKNKTYAESSDKINVRTPLRSHPGTATRMLSPPVPRSLSLDLDSDNVSEQQFVKLKASRIVDYTSTPCPGTLLITPKFLVFDPMRISTGENLDEVVNIPKPIANMAVSISLDSVFSLNTYSKLSEVINEKHIVFEDDPDFDNTESSEFIDDEDDFYLVLKAVPMSDCYTGQSFTSIRIHSLHKDCKLFSFAIHKDRIEEVYSFLISCIGAAYNNNPVDSRDSTVTPKREEEEVVEDKHKYLVNMLSWEVVDMSQCSVVADALKEFEQAKFRPQYNNGKSEILTDSMLDDIASELPVNLNGCNLNLVYRTGTHGYSLGTIYRKMKAFNKSTLLLIRDNSNTVFGAFMSDPFHVSNHYYGTGETFVFHWKPDFKKYEWTRDNSFFMKGDANCFAIGAKSGHSAIWFEDTLKFGRSEPTDTFDNPTLCGDCEDVDRSKAEAMIRSLSVDKAQSIISNNGPSPSALSSQGYYFVIDCLEVWRFSV